MIAFERSTDYDLIRAVITSPEVWAGASDDFAGDPKDWKPFESDLVWYVLAFEDGALLGLFCLFPENRVSWEVHTCLLKRAWGPKAREVARQAIDWVWQKDTTVSRIVTRVPSHNRVALRFAIEAGMVEYGINPQSFMKRGKLRDVALLGISRPMVPCENCGKLDTVQEVVCQ